MTPKVYRHETPQDGCCCCDCDGARKEAAVFERVRAAVAQEREACLACCRTDDSPRWDNNDCCARTARAIAEAIQAGATP